MFSGGVGIEYRYIIEDIYINPNKYILCTFLSFNEFKTSDILPGGLLGRNIISLSDEKNNNYQTLFGKLMDYKSINISPISETKPILNPKRIIPFETLQQSNITDILINKNELFKKVKKYLFENKQILMQYGPPSFIATKNPLSDVYLIWKDKKASSILPNNSKIVEIIENHIDLLLIDEQEIFFKFKEHALCFELNSKNRIDSEATIRFPKDFENMINSEVK